jgi:hypothetical protein
MNNATITIQPRYDDVEGDATPADLYWHHYDGQREHQPVILSLDLRDGELLVDFDGRIGSGTPTDVYYGRVLWFTLPYIPTPAAANALLDRVTPKAQAILDAIAASANEGDDDDEPSGIWNEASWDESQLDAHADPSGTARAALQEYLDQGAGFNDADIVAVWDIDGIDCSWADDVTADMDDDRIDALAGEILSELASNGGHGAAVCSGLTYWLRANRDELRSSQG